MKKSYFNAIVKHNKKTEGGRGFEVVASTADFDREGESIDQSGWDLENYLKNPIILWSHDINSLPIGKATSVKVVEDQLIIKGEFATAEQNPVAEQAFLLYDADILKTVSVGFIPLDRKGDTILKAELLELSFVPVPANPQALALAKEKNIPDSFFAKSLKKEKVPEVDKDTKINKKNIKQKFFMSLNKKRLAIGKGRKEEGEEEVTDSPIDTSTETGKELEITAVDVKNVIVDIIEQAVPMLEEATEKQLEGEPVIDEIIKEIEEVVDKNIAATQAPIEDEVATVVATEGEKADGDVVVAEAVVEENFEVAAKDIVDEVSVILEAKTLEIVETIEDESKATKATEDVAAVIIEIEKALEVEVPETLEKSVEPVAVAAVEEADPAVETSEEEGDEEKDFASLKNICDPESEEYDADLCAAGVVEAGKKKD
jgi:HK97 family phage prohead protease